MLKKNHVFAGLSNTLCAAGRFSKADKVWTQDCQKGYFRAAAAKRQFFADIFR
jgi:hypothetical protein